MFQWLKRITVSNNFANRCPERIQMEATECGAVSLQMVLEYYGVIIPTEVMRDECQVSRDGSKASSLLKTARKYGFTARGYHVAHPSHILNNKMPAILFWEFNHFLVCLGRKGNKWVLNDPAVGRRIITDEEMNSSFTGILLEIKPGPRVKKQGKPPSFIRNMAFLLTSCRTELLMLFVIGLLLLPQSIVQPHMNRLLMDHFFQNGYHSWGGPILCFSLLMLALTIGLTFIQQASFFQLNIKMTITNSCKILTKLFSLPLPFFQSRFSGDLTNRVQCCESVASFFSEQFVINLLSFMSVFFFAVLLIHYDQVLGSLVSIFAMILVVILLRFMNAKKATCTRSVVELGKMYGRTVHGMSMIETLKASGMENEFFGYWSDIYKRYMRTRMELCEHMEILELVQSAISGFSVAILAGFGAYRILLGQMTGGTYISFQMVFACFMMPIYSLIGMIDQFQNVRADANQLVDILHYPMPKNEVRTSSCPDKNASKLSGRVVIRNLVFGYNRNMPPVIDHVSLEISSGERVAIVGLSGSGKSTMAKLISGAYQPWSGEILFDGRPRDSYTQQELRYSFAMVDQSISLLPGNIRDNIAMYDNSLPFEHIRRAAEDALIHQTIIARNGGYAHEINATGSNFSGGEQQRLEIARALAVNPSILLLDEATAALDPATELKLDRNLRRRGVTMIVIAHRLSTIRDADRIVVLDHGKIVECGNHNELLKLNGRYAQLVNV